MNTATSTAGTRTRKAVTEPEAAVVPLRRVSTDFDVPLWAYIETWEAALPAHPAGTLVRYQLRAHDEDSGETYWADDGAEYSYVVGDSGPPAWARRGAASGNPPKPVRLPSC